MKTNNITCDIVTTKEELQNKKVKLTFLKIGWQGENI